MHTLCFRRKHATLLILGSSARVQDLYDYRGLRPLLTQRSDLAYRPRCILHQKCHFLSFQNATAMQLLPNPTVK